VHGDLQKLISARLTPIEEDTIQLIGLTIQQPRYRLALHETPLESICSVSAEHE
jgi:hypothetical protein